MPGFIAKKLCPGLVIVPGNHAKYKVVSEQVVQVNLGACRVCAEPLARFGCPMSIVFW